MRVLLDTTYARRGPSGTGVYIERVIAALRAEGVDVVEAADERRRPPAGGGLGSARNLAHDAWWVQAGCPAAPGPRAPTSSTTRCPRTRCARRARRS